MSESHSSRPIHVLFLAYYFPPLGGAGSQRSLKFVKYLPGHGFLPSVLAGEVGGADRWAPVDDALCREVGREIRIRRVNLFEKPFESGWRRSIRDFVGAGSQFGNRWLKAATKVAREMCSEVPPDIIIATMSPFESAGIAGLLSREFGVPWVADLRDPWALDEWQVYPSRWHRRSRQKQMERKLRSASLTIMNTPEAVNRFRHAFPQHRQRVISITNGYDVEDFEEPVVPAETGRFTIVHAGALHTTAGFRQKLNRRSYRILGRTEPGVELLTRSHLYLVKAIEQWMREDPGIHAKIRLQFIGVPESGDIKVVESSEVGKITDFLGYLSHTESIRRIREAELLFLPMHKLSRGVRATIVPGKTYEYLASGRPILGAVPEGDCRDFLIAAGNSHVCGPDDIDGILAAVKAEFAKWERGESSAGRDRNFVEKFERGLLTKELAAELSRLGRREIAVRTTPCAQISSPEISREYGSVEG